MPTSDSEDFESADEGHSTVTRKSRQSRHSSSNYSDNTLESGPEAHEAKVPSSTAKNEIKDQPKEEVKESDGWDDFDVEVDNTATVTTKPVVKDSQSGSKKAQNSAPTKKSQDTGWDEFDDWGDENTTDKVVENPQKTEASKADNIKEVTERLAAVSTDNKQPSSSGWGWGGWGVDSLLSSATAGITTLTNQVSQGITNVLETGIGAPDPEDLARMAKEGEQNPKTEPRTQDEMTDLPEESKSGGDAFPFGNLLKFVGDTGSKVITGGLDTLETIGRKTMEVLQDGDPGLAKKRAMLGLDADKPSLSQVLREAKAKAEVEDSIREEKREAKEVHYERLFDDFEGLVHLEALEMLSKQVSMRIEEQLRAAAPDKRLDMKETMLQVLELCEMPDDDDDADDGDDDGDSQPTSPGDALAQRLVKATQDLGAKLHFQPIVKQYTEVLSWLSTSQEETVKAVYKRAISTLAQNTALCVELYHKAGEMLLVKSRRSTADEADALMQMTLVLTKHTGVLANLFTDKLHSMEDPAVNNYITNIFLESGNSRNYIETASRLTQPIIQIGAI